MPAATRWNSWGSPSPLALVSPAAMRFKIEISERRSWLARPENVGDGGRDAGAKQFGVAISFMAYKLWIWEPEIYNASGELRVASREWRYIQLTTTCRYCHEPFNEWLVAISTSSSLDRRRKLYLSFFCDEFRLVDGVNHSTRWKLLFVCLFVYLFIYSLSSVIL